jgi:predicted O-methyltransferase YrrM
LKKIKFFNREYKSFYIPSGYEINGDGSILFGMVRFLKPKKVIEIGGGNSTRVLNLAMDLNERENSKKNGSSKIISIDPYPSKTLLELLGKSSRIHVISKPVQKVSKVIFEQLEENDILFIDSTHNIKCGNDVHFLYLEILPYLAVGVVVHIHDIRFPQDYPREWIIKRKYFWNEQYLLYMFLCFNDSFKILFASNYMKLRYPKEFRKSVEGLEDDGWPGSFWIKRIK